MAKKKKQQRRPAAKNRKKQTKKPARRVLGRAAIPWGGSMILGVDKQWTFRTEEQINAKMEHLQQENPGEYTLRVFPTPDEIPPDGVATTDGMVTDKELAHMAGLKIAATYDDARAYMESRPPAVGFLPGYPDGAPDDWDDWGDWDADDLDADTE